MCAGVEHGHVVRRRRALALCEGGNAAAADRRRGIGGQAAGAAAASIPGPYARASERYAPFAVVLRGRRVILDRYRQRFVNVEPLQELVQLVVPAALCAAQ